MLPKQFDYLNYDIAFGGMFYVIVDADKYGFGLYIHLRSCDKIYINLLIHCKTYRADLLLSNNSTF